MSDILIKRNHMEIPWHNYVSARNSQPITEASLSEKASLIGRTGMMLLSCGTGAWRVRSSMNTLSEALGITCSADIGLMSISYTCFDGESSFSHALSLTTTGVNTSRLNRLEHFVSDFPAEGIHMSGEALHSQLDEIERIHGLYSPASLGLASALACGAFTFLLGGGPLEMILAESQDPFCDGKKYPHIPDPCASGSGQGSPEDTCGCPSFHKDLPTYHSLPLL